MIIFTKTMITWMLEMLNYVLFSKMNFFFILIEWYINLDELKLFIKYAINMDNLKTNKK